MSGSRAGLVRTGLDRIAAGDGSALASLRGRSVGLLAHPASVDRRLRHALPILLEAGVRVRALFGPEHGFGGEAQDMVGVDSKPRGAIPTYSLYGTSAAALMPRPEWLEGLDAVVVDLQDVGSRYYTYVWTAALMLRAAAARGIQLIVLDRPNPLGGDRIEGRPQRPGYRSFVGLYDLPVRHGLTLAEIVEFVRREEGIDEAALEIVEVRGWQRRMSFQETGLPWVLPSPNMPTVETAQVYPGGCVIEGTSLSEGRGCTRPFEIFGAPWLDGEALARSVTIEGALLRPLRFQPTFHKHAGMLCGGVQVHIVQPASFRPYEAYLRLIAEALMLRPEGLMPWRTEPYEFVESRPAIDLLTGGPEYRQAVNEGASLTPLLEAEREGAHDFFEARKSLLRYR